MYIRRGSTTSWMNNSKPQFQNISGSLVGYNNYMQSCSVTYEYCKPTNNICYSSWGQNDNGDYCTRIKNDPSSSPYHPDNLKHPTRCPLSYALVVRSADAGASGYNGREGYAEYDTDADPRTRSVPACRNYCQNFDVDFSFVQECHGELDCYEDLDPCRGHRGQDFENVVEKINYNPALMIPRNKPRFPKCPKEKLGKKRKKGRKKTKCYYDWNFSTKLDSTEFSLSLREQEAKLDILEELLKHPGNGQEGPRKPRVKTFKRPPACLSVNLRPSHLSSWFKFDPTSKSQKVLRTALNGPCSSRKRKSKPKPTPSLHAFLKAKDHPHLSLAPLKTFSKLTKAVPELKSLKTRTDFRPNFDDGGMWGANVALQRLRIPTVSGPPAISDSASVFPLGKPVKEAESRFFKQLFSETPSGTVVNVRKDSTHGSPGADHRHDLNIEMMGEEEDSIWEELLPVDPMGLHCNSDSSDDRRSGGCDLEDPMRSCSDCPRCSHPCSPDPEDLWGGYSDYPRRSDPCSPDPEDLWGGYSDYPRRSDPGSTDPEDLWGGYSDYPRRSEPSDPRRSNPDDSRYSDPCDSRWSDSYQAKFSNLSDPRCSDVCDSKWSDSYEPRLSNLSDPRCSDVCDPSKCDTNDLTYDRDYTIRSPYPDSLDTPQPYDTQDGFDVLESQPHRPAYRKYHRVDRSKPNQVKMNYYHDEAPTSYKFTPHAIKDRVPWDPNFQKSNNPNHKHQVVGPIDNKDCCCGHPSCDCILPSADPTVTNRQQVKVDGHCNFPTVSNDPKELNGKANFNHVHNHHKHVTNYNYDTESSSYPNEGNLKEDTFGGHHHEHGTKNNYNPESSIDPNERNLKEDKFGGHHHEHGTKNNYNPESSIDPNERNLKEDKFGGHHHEHGTKNNYGTESCSYPNDRSLKDDKFGGHHHEHGTKTNYGTESFSYPNDQNLTDVRFGGHQHEHGTKNNYGTESCSYPNDPNLKYDKFGGHQLDHRTKNNYGTESCSYPNDRSLKDDKFGGHHYEHGTKNNYGTESCSYPNDRNLKDDKFGGYHHEHGTKNNYGTENCSYPNDRNLKDDKFEGHQHEHGTKNNYGTENCSYPNDRNLKYDKFGGHQHDHRTKNNYGTESCSYPNDQNLKDSTFVGHNHHQNHKPIHEFNRNWVMGKIKDHIGPKTNLEWDQNGPISRNRIYQGPCDIKRIRDYTNRANAVLQGINEEHPSVFQDQQLSVDECIQSDSLKKLEYSTECEDTGPSSSYGNEKSRHSYPDKPNNECQRYPNYNYKSSGPNGEYKYVNPNRTSQADPSGLYDYYDLEDQSCRIDTKSVDPTRCQLPEGNNTPISPISPITLYRSGNKKNHPLVNGTCHREDPNRLVPPIHYENTHRPVEDENDHHHRRFPECRNQDPMIPIVGQNYRPRVDKGNLYGSHRPGTEDPKDEC